MMNHKNRKSWRTVIIMLLVLAVFLVRTVLELVGG